MKQIFTFLILSFSFFLFSPLVAEAEKQEKYFIVTAYYSPLPDQEYYITGNYEDELRLNGQGIAGASGKKVFSGMLAAPKSYPFGSKIHLDGLGIGSIEDRGGAIVPAGQRGYSHDRIDVWVGYGDEGLRRAMYWGKRKVLGEILPSNTKTKLDYTSIPAPSWAVPQHTTLYGKKIQVKQNTKENEINIFHTNLGKGSDETYIHELQKILNNLDFLKSGSFIEGNYDTATIDAVFELQIQTGILENSHDTGAGFFGPKTRKELEIIYDEYLTQEAKKTSFLETYKIMQEETQRQSEEIISSLLGVSYGEISHRVRTLQKQLQKLEVFDYQDTAIFGKKTENSIIEYQLRRGIISSSKDIGAGIVGPRTREKMSSDISEILLQEKIFSLALTQEYEAYILDTSNSKNEEEKISSKNIQIYSM